MNQERLLEIERNFRALIDSLTAEELEAELRRIEEAVSEFEKAVEAVSELEKTVSKPEKPYQNPRNRIKTGRGRREPHNERQDAGRP